MRRRFSIPSCVTLVVAITLSNTSCGVGGPSLHGDWDHYRMLGAKPSGGFDALRRFGFAHFEKTDTTGAWINRRSGTRLEHIHNLTVTGDSLILDLDAGTSIRARFSYDTIAGQYYRGKDPTQRVWFVRRTSPPVYEPFYSLWPGPVSDSSTTLTIDPAVPMKTRDGTVLMNFVDIFLGAHGNYFDMEAKYSRMKDGARRRSSIRMAT
jgi:hypothetical protein